MKTLFSALTVTLVMALAAPAWARDDAATALITGSNAGHGLAFVEKYAALGWNVIATCRTPEKADRLQALAWDYMNTIKAKRLVPRTAINS